MQLRVARVCLDCEEVHDAAECPVCASESFAFLSRWVPAQERRANPRLQAATKPAGRTGKVLVGVSVFGGAAYLLNRWMKTAREKIEHAAESRPSGELR